MRLLSLLTLGAALFVSLNMTGCVPLPPPPPQPGPGVNYYQTGYNDGCWTKRHPGTKKNNYLYNHHYSYRNGWHKGYNVCKPYMKPIKPVPLKPVPVVQNRYQQGYNDGCWSKRHAGTKKNYNLYNNNYTYRNGWNKGYNVCKPYVKPLPKPMPYI